jgi:hypothetical protein
MRKSLAIIIPAAIAAIAFPVPASANPSPNTCLKPFVWREAFPGDVVCVSTKTRAQVALDNAAAPLRRDPNAGFGPNGCRSRFVWRVARASDLVCVDPVQRRQAAADNAEAARRRNSVATTLTHWMRGGTWRYGMTATNINVGGASLFLYRSSDGRLIGRWNAPATPASDRPGGRVQFRTDRLECNGSFANAYFVVKDLTSGAVSQRRNVNTDCVPI